MLAAYHGHAPLVSLLIQHGADPDRLNDRGQSPLAGVVFKNEAECIKLLLDAGADPEIGTPSALAATQVSLCFVTCHWLRRGRGRGGDVLPCLPGYSENGSMCVQWQSYAFYHGCRLHWHVQMRVSKMAAISPGSCNVLSTAPQSPQEDASLPQPLYDNTGDFPQSGVPYARQSATRPWTPILCAHRFTPVHQSAGWMPVRHSLSGLHSMNQL